MNLYSYLQLKYTKEIPEDFFPFYIRSLPKRWKEKGEVWYQKRELEKTEVNIQSNGSKLMLLFLNEIIRRMLKELKIPKKDLRLVCMDYEKLHILDILENLADDLNYLTIVTKRPEIYEGFITRQYEENGLIPVVLERPLRMMAPGNVILNFGGDESKESLYFENGAAVLDFSEGYTFQKELLAKRKDLKYWNHIFFKTPFGEVDGALVEQALEEGNIEDIFLWLKEHDFSFSRMGVKRKS